MTEQNSGLSTYQERFAGPADVDTIVGMEVKFGEDPSHSVLMVVWEHYQIVAFYCQYGLQVGWLELPTGTICRTLRQLNLELALFRTYFTAT